ncbi:hypothetical protein SSPO_005570 [Streptomyces antimycoticus]|uniref:Uncharacterized protein n=1 Tax=Streptomyces antimycoticus TaxID=68175 RepID=A0A499UL45_9ACTN|nr:hypothetical protein SSPO_005570 [Streptomyces antimycoticus]
MGPASVRSACPQAWRQDSFRNLLGYLAHLEPDQLEYARGFLIAMYNDTRKVLRETGRPCNPATVVREVVARFALAVTAAARRLARGEVTMQEIVDSMEILDRVHSMGGRRRPAAGRRSRGRGSGPQWRPARSRSVCGGMYLTTVHRR